MALDPVRTATANRRTMPERPQAWSRPMSARSCPASTMDTTIGQPSGHRLPGRIRPDMVTSSRHAMATRKQCGQRTNERHRSPSDILDRHHHNGGPPDTPSLSCGPGVCGLPTKVDSAMATLPARPQLRQLLVSLHRSSRASGALLSSDDYGSSVDRAAKLHPLWQGLCSWKSSDRWSGPVKEPRRWDPIGGSRSGDRLGVCLGGEFGWPVHRWFRCHAGTPTLGHARSSSTASHSGWEGMAAGGRDLVSPAVRAAARASAAPDGRRGTG
jgi:hypothetical protein